MTLNKALLGRQPKPFDVFSFHSVVLSVFGFCMFFGFFMLKSAFFSEHIKPNRKCLFVSYQNPR